MKFETTKITTRMCETDAIGHINNTSYFIYLEQARVDFFRKIQSQLPGYKRRFILASAKCDFINQAYFDQSLIISTSVQKIGTKSYQLEHLIVDAETKQVIAKGEDTNVCFDFEKQQTQPIDSRLKSLLESYLTS